MTMRPHRSRRLSRNWPKRRDHCRPPPAQYFLKHFGRRIDAPQLEYLAKAEVSGIVLGARVPIILTSRADKTLGRLSSCAIALLMARYTKEILP
jgi:hypothetical protein